MDEQQGASEGITRIAVAGYKSIAEEQSIEIRPLTILAGANSSGKSSIVQPLLLLKQTLEASYDPGPLLLDGPNVKFTSAGQLLSKTGGGEQTDSFSVGIEVGADRLAIHFQKRVNGGLGIQEMTRVRGWETITLREGMTHDQIMSAIPTDIRGMYTQFPNKEKEKPEWVVVRNRCFLEPELKAWPGVRVPFFSLSGLVEPHIRRIIHLPGLRGNPQRTYPLTAVGPTFPGTFQEYTASVIAGWEMVWRYDALEEPIRDLENLDLTSVVATKRIDDTQVELQVGRHIRAKEGDLDWVSVADVGFGVSQALPVVVALHVAEPGQLVYLEQPEIHLHPRAQVAMASVLAKAAQRGVRVVAETHSALLLLGVQTLVAEGKLPPELVKLHWFSQREDGATEISNRDLDETGAFGDWPQDFGLVELEAESRYLDAVESHYRGS